LHPRAFPRETYTAVGMGSLLEGPYGVRETSKLGVMIVLLRRKDGATVEILSEATRAGSSIPCAARCRARSRKGWGWRLRRRSPMDV
jgi:hypothetical protein